MEYYGILNFISEPFSNSPDPECFYAAAPHVECLQKLELAVRLRRGLNIVIGDVGSGKTTLCRQIIRKLATDENVETYLLLDRCFSKPVEFLHAITDMLGIDTGKTDITEWQLREEIKRYLFSKGINDNKLLVLIIDEGQKLPDFCLEMLREFLNYETNEHKLLQIIIFAQKEFYQVLEEHPGFADRVNFSYDLQPMTFADTRAMIRFRLDIAGDSGGGSNSVRFTFPALWAIYRATGGYPRKIVGLCHQIILALIIQNRSRVGWSLVRSCIRRGKTVKESARIAWVTAIAGMVLVLLLGFEPGYKHFIEIFEYSSSAAESMYRPAEEAISMKSGSEITIQPMNTVVVPAKASVEVHGESSGRTISCGKRAFVHGESSGRAVYCRRRSFARGELSRVAGAADHQKGRDDLQSNQKCIRG
ncbi:MAG: AAA family ATPase [Deltaproteobacteria bacterium]|nr:AAA family ATPase [Deltaproteobacteria bacterium]